VIREAMGIAWGRGGGGREEWRRGNSLVAFGLCLDRSALPCSRI
jgi:hypothetical protein